MVKIQNIYNFLVVQLNYSYRLINIGNGILDKFLIFFELLLYFKIFFIGKRRNNSYQLKDLKFKLNIKTYNNVIQISSYYELLFFSGCADSKNFKKILLNKKYKNLLDLGLNVGRISLIFLKYNLSAKFVYGIDAS